MKNSIRTRFTLGMIFLFLIILVLSVFSGYYLNKLSNKTGAILKENYLSVVYARDMTEGLTVINRELSASFLSGQKPDTTKINNQLSNVDRSLTLEKNNITEPGEDKLVNELSSLFEKYKSKIRNDNEILKSEELSGLLLLSGELDQKLIQLSQMNGNAIESKTDDAKASATSALTQMTILASLCFLIGMSFTFSFASYFNQRFYQLYNGIKQIVSSNFDQRLFFDHKDEFYEISLVFNEMAEKLKKNDQKLSVNLFNDEAKQMTSANIDELKQMMFRMKVLEEHAAALISKLENK